MVLLLLSASWILTLSVIAGLCIAARDGDLQHDRPTSPAVVGEPMDPSSAVTITRVKHGQHTTPDYAPSDLGKTVRMNRRAISGGAVLRLEAIARRTAE
ncbi:MAG: hypothetical protein ABSG95_15335 [Solirubrobacteraceae bacterium]|jgi:hypothetical protein